MQDSIAIPIKDVGRKTEESVIHITYKEAFERMEALARELAKQLAAAADHQAAKDATPNPNAPAGERR
jgi:hypothetical protein